MESFYIQIFIEGNDMLRKMSAMLYVWSIWLLRIGTNSMICTYWSNHYHDKCILEWINKNKKCPCCRKKISKTTILSDANYNSLAEVYIKLVAEEKNKAKWAIHNKESEIFWK